MNDSYFLPYQRRWLADNSRIKIWEKSRRIGATFVQSYEDVRDCIKGEIPDCWFTSADATAAREYIEYAEMWAKMFDAAAEPLGLQVVDSDKDIQAYVIRYSNGVKQYALASNPKAFRSKGGKVIWDEAAWHDDPAKMWAAMRPVITWGFPLRILSTHNGKNSFFNKRIEEIHKGKLNWSLHTTDIYTAAEEGLVAKIKKQQGIADAEIENWINQERRDCADETVWAQEYECKPVDESTAFFPYALLAEIERDDILCDLEQITNPLFIGVDIGRKKDLTVIWGLEKLGLAKYSRFVKIMEKAKFRHQREALFPILSHPTMRRACIDSTGLGMQLAEECRDKFGRFRVEEITFNAGIKEEMAYDILTEAQDKTIFIPDDADIREDIHSIRKIITSTGKIRFDVGKSETNGHADRFWALALANHAAKNIHTGIPSVNSRKRGNMRKKTENY